MSNIVRSRTPPLVLLVDEEDLTARSLPTDAAEAKKRTSGKQLNDFLLREGLAM
jgi:hypothetical protein